MSNDINFYTFNKELDTKYPFRVFSSELKLDELTLHKYLMDMHNCLKIFQKVKVVFKKKNGELRTMICSNHSDVILNGMTIKYNHDKIKILEQQRKYNERQNKIDNSKNLVNIKDLFIFNVWDIEANDWRAFNHSQIISFDIEK